MFLQNSFIFRLKKKIKTRVFFSFRIFLTEILYRLKKINASLRLRLKVRVKIFNLGQIFYIKLEEETWKLPIYARSVHFSFYT